MKNSLRILAAALVVASASVAEAQGGGGGGGRMDPAQMAERQAAARAALFEGITLTADQKAKIDTIYANTQKEQMDMRASMQGGGGDMTTMREKMAAITTKQQAAIKAVLTKEQNEVYDKNYAARPQGRRGGR